MTKAKRRAQTMKLTGDINRKNLTQMVYDTIKNSIIFQDIAPGTKLQEAFLKGALKVSNTPIRTALNVLSQEGLVDFRPRKGFFVARVDASDIEEVLDMRALMEGLAARYIVEKNRVNKLLLRKLEKCVKKGALLPGKNGYRQYGNIDAEFHQTIIQASDAKMLPAIINNFCDRLRLMKIWQFIRDERVKKSTNEHRLILEALEKKDARLAEERVREHFRNCKENLVARLSSMTK